MVAWDCYKATANSGTIGDPLGNAGADQVRRNCHFIKKLQQHCYYVPDKTLLFVAIESQMIL